MQAATFPARGTWIEMQKNEILTKTIGQDVPRKGNVDRNNAILSGEEGGGATFPARGTWIEIRPVLDRRAFSPRRSPQGERG